MCHKWPIDLTAYLELCLLSLASVIWLSAYPASFQFVHYFVSGMQSFYFSESQDAIVLQTFH